MNDHDLSASQVDRLELLLQRTAERVPVDPDPSLPADIARPSLPSRSHGRRWFAAAAVVVLVAAVGGAWWFVADDGQRVDSGPADPPSVTVAPEVLEQTGVWRLPEGLDDVRVVDVQRSNAVPELLFAFDDPDAPSRWVALGRDGLRPSLPSDDVVRHPVDDGVHLVEWGAEGAGWTGYEVRIDNGMGTGDNPAMTVITQGVERDQVVEMLRSTFPDRADFIEADRLTEALGSIELPDGLQPTWDEADLASTFGEPLPGTPTNTGLELTLVDDADREIVVSLSEWAGATALRLSTEVVSEVMSSNRGDDMPDAVVYRMHPRPDLGDDVFELTYGVGDEHDADRGSILVVTDDGVVISAIRAVLASATGPDTGPEAEPLTEAEQLRIINSLRATTEADFRAQLERLGASYGDPNLAGPTHELTTTVPGG